MNIVLKSLIKVKTFKFYCFGTIKFLWTLLVQSYLISLGTNRILGVYSDVWIAYELSGLALVSIGGLLGLLGLAADTFQAHLSF